MSCCHCSKISGGSQETVVCKYGRKKMKKINMYDFPAHYCTQEQKGSPHTFLPWFDNVNRCICQERLLRSRNFATMVTWRHTSLLYSGWLFLLTPDAMKFTKYANKDEILGLVLKSLRATW